jgi:ABC-type sugar transport system substrate-binding protein
MKTLFCALFAALTIAQVAAAETQCYAVITGRDIHGENRYMVSCSDDGGPWYSVSKDGLTAAEAEAILNEVEGRNLSDH